MSQIINIVVDVEADGPCPGLYSMIEIGAVVVDGKFDRTFQAQLRPIAPSFQESALSAIGRTRSQTLAYPYAAMGMFKFEKWLESLEARPVFWSDNPAFDWQFVNYYFHSFELKNHFGFSARRIGDLYAGLRGNPKDTTSWKSMRITQHTHNALDDALGNAEALWRILNEPMKNSDKKASKVIIDKPENKEVSLENPKPI